jgi:hypothetical protein
MNVSMEQRTVIHPYRTLFRAGNWTVAGLPKVCALIRLNRPLDQLNTLGDHLLRRRLILKLLQRQVAERIGVDKTRIAN